MAAKKAPKKPKFTPRPYKPRKPKPKPRRTDDEILADARKELKKITDGPKFSHRPYKPKKTKPKITPGSVFQDARTSKPSRNNRGESSQQTSLPKHSGQESKRMATNQHQQRDRVPKIKFISTNDPCFPIGYSSRYRGQTRSGFIYSSETFLFVFENRPLNIHQFEAFLRWRRIVEAPIEVLYSLSIYYRKSRSPWDSDMPVLVFSLAYNNYKSFPETQDPLWKAWGGPIMPGSLKVFRYKAINSPFTLFLPENFHVDQACVLLLNLGLRELKMTERDISFVGELHEVRANHPAVS